jgi:peptidoglycan-N-acetylglucosamine deacetylase
MAAGSDSERYTPDAQAAEHDIANAAARRRRARRMAFGVGAILVIATVAALAFFGPIPLSVDGRTVWVARGTTVSQLIYRRMLLTQRGDLISVKGTVLRAGGGQDPVALVGGSAVPTSTVVTSGARITARRGIDVTEPVVTTMVGVDAPTDYRGSGPVITIETSGTPGSTRVTRGAISKIVLSRVVVSTPVAMVVRREQRYTGAKTVALTFDDGPWPGQTDKVLGILTAAKVKATFFEIGGWATRYPALSKLVVADGMEIGDHSQTHKLLGTVGHAVVTSEIARGAASVQQASGVSPTWFRPPGGSLSTFVVAETKRLGLRLVLWTIDPKDWKRPSPKIIAQRVLDQVRPGSVILMHDGGGDRTNTIAALPVIIKALKARGYQMVTLSQMYGPGPAPAKP